MTTFGVDVSSPVSGSKLATAGSKFLVSRCITELGTADKNFVGNVKQALSSGQIPGGYHWLVPAALRSPADQAKQFYDAVAPYLDPTVGFLPQCDIERGSGTDSPRWSDIVGFYDEWRKLTSWPCFPYSNPSYWSHLGVPAQGSAQLGINQFWLAYYVSRYTTAASLAVGYPGDTDSRWGLTLAGGFKPVLLQFMGTVTIAGYNVDQDAFRGSVEELRALGGGMFAEVTITPFPDGVRTWHVKAGTVLNAYDPAQPGVTVKSVKFSADSSASADAEVAVAWYSSPGQVASPSPIPHGSPFLRVANGTFAGLLIVKRFVTVDAPPPPALVITQADLVQAYNDGLNAATSVVSAIPRRVA